MSGLVFSASIVSAMQFQTLGYKSVAMGGAAVASSSSSLAIYNNPALLAKEKYGTEVSLGGGVSYKDFGAAASVQALSDSGFLDTIDKVSNNITSLTEEDKQILIKGKNIVIGMNNDALSVNPQGYIAAKFSNFGFGIFGSSDVVGTAKVDQGRDLIMIKDNSNPGNYLLVNDNGTTGLAAGPSADILYQTKSIEYALNNGLTYMDVTGLMVAEIPIGYGRQIEFSNGKLSIGGALKYMRGYTYTEQYKIDNSGSANSGSGKKDRTSSTVGIDLGLAYEPSLVKDLTVAIVAKNLNSPKFDFVNSDKVTVKPMYRIGVAYDILDSLEVAADFDLSANKTFVESTKSQMLGGGLNWHPTSWFALRGGLMQNMDANDKAGLIYTAGFGFGLKWLQLDISGQYSSNSATVNGTTVPEYAKINVALVSKW